MQTRLISATITDEEPVYSLIGGGRPSSLLRSVGTFADQGNKMVASGHVRQVLE